MTEIYHYTTVDALLGILRGKEKICLWATDFRYLNDPSEFYVGIKFVNSYIHEVEQKLGIKEKDSIREKFIWQNVLEFKGFSSMIISLSENIDSLPMWNMYGKNGKGLVLIFDRDNLEKYCREHSSYCFLDACVYYDHNYEDNREHIRFDNFEETRKLCHNVLLNIYESTLKTLSKENYLEEDKQDAIAVAIFTHFCPFVKHFAYSYEREHRIAIRVYDSNLKENSCKDIQLKNYTNPELIEFLEKIPLQSFGFRERNGVLVPYTKFSLPIHLLKGIIIGPTSNYYQCKASIEMFLKNYDINLPIYKSNVPYIIN